MGKGIPTKGREMLKSKRCDNNNFLGNGGERGRKKGHFDSSVKWREPRPAMGDWLGKGKWEVRLFADNLQKSYRTVNVLFFLKHLCMNKPDKY